MLTCCQLYCECRDGVGVSHLGVILPNHYYHTINISDHNFWCSWLARFLKDCLLFINLISSFKKIILGIFLKGYNLKNLLDMSKTWEFGWNSRKLSGVFCIMVNTYRRYAHISYLSFLIRWMCSGNLASL